MLAKVLEVRFYGPHSLIPGLSRAIHELGNTDLTTICTPINEGGLTCHWDQVAGEWFVAIDDSDGGVPTDMPGFVTWVPTRVHIVRRGLRGEPEGNETTYGPDPAAPDWAVTRMAYSDGGNPAFNLTVTARNLSMARTCYEVYCNPKRVL